MDQVCIHQSNFAERSHQVNFMDEIYRRTEHVLISITILLLGVE